MPDPAILKQVAGLVGPLLAQAAMVPTYPDSGSITYQVTGTHVWTNPGIPPGHEALFEVCGGGGGGCRSLATTNGGDGGGGGGYAAGVVGAAAIASGGTMIVGAGGATATSSTGNDGVSSVLTLNSVVLLTGGLGHKAVHSGAGGTGGTATADGSVTSQVLTPGVAGAFKVGAVGGNGGASGQGATGGAGGTAASGGNGNVPGGGGGGSGVGAGLHGGAGGNGFIKITWPPV